MTVTDELRRMLDERGVEWDYGITGATTTRFSVNGIDLTFTPMRDGLVCSTILTPEQAIEATLGRGECHITVEDNLAETEGMGDVWLECSACHWQMPLEPTTPLFNYCPNCGAKVVDV